MISADTTIRELYKLGLISVRAMNVCRAGEIDTLGRLLSIDKLDLLRIRNCGRKTLTEIDEIRERYQHYIPDNSSPESTEECSSSEATELVEARKKLELLPPNVTVQFKGWLSWKYNELSVRAKNAFPHLNQLEPILTAIYSIQKFNAIDAKNIGKKTSGEIQLFLEETKLQFEKITKNIDPDSHIKQFSEFDRLVAQIGEQYPFLLTKECEKIATFITKYNIPPFLFIAKQYILRANDGRIDIHRDYYGLNPEGKRYSLLEISVKNNLTRERIRQLVNKSIKLPENLENEIIQYLKPILKNVVPFDSLLWKKVQRDNMLEESYFKTALLVCAIIGTHTIIQIDDSDKEYLVKKSLIENVKIRNVLYNICRIIEQRRTKIEQLDILEYIKAHKRIYHSDVEELCCIYANFLKIKYDVDIEDNRYVMMLPNALDVSMALENILEQKGIQMSLEELLVAFNTLHPSNTIDDPLKLKPYIFRNTNIIPKGKTGIYVLKDWKNHFTGTLTEYLEHILMTIGEPITLDDLVDFALQEFPKSNKKSIYSLITRDRDNRFIVYEDEYIGLAASPISEAELKARRIIKRHSFETRFDDLKQFVLTRKRLPIQTGSEDEQSLARWITNVLKANIESPEEQIETLKTFLLEHKTLPQNGTEYNFRQMCDEIKVMVTQSFALPTTSENPREYIWLHKNIQKYTTYKDNRKLYFEDLLSYLRDFGFYL